ncbi:MAG: hypothetical protein NDJ72_04165 [Elusimicrobia bacterium]|nr:hypothetical protein [Elusimicrobiota bacterium]
MRAAALAAAALFCWALADVSPALYRPGEAIDTDVYHSGEMLLHGIKYRATTENYHLPLSSISSALAHNHVPPGDGSLRRRLSAAAAILLLLALGVELGAPWHGLLGAALLLFVSRFPLPVTLAGSWHGHWGHLQSFFTVLVLGAAGLMARHLRAPSRAGAWAVALALGASLLYRSTMVFFPPLLALFHLGTLKREPSREDWKTAAVLGLAPYAFLLPWIASNWAVHGRFIPLEDGEAAPIIVGGVLGHVEKEWARVPASLDLAARGTFETLLWALDRIQADPAAYLTGYVRRLYFIFLLNPLLFLFAGLAFWFNRRSRAFLALGLLCGYWVLAHACMSILREYFDPLWPLLAAAAGAGLAPFLKAAPPAGARKASGVLLTGALAAVLGLCVFVHATLAAHAWALTRGGAAGEARRLDAAIARHPGLAGPRFERGMRRLEAGAVAEAEPDLDEAARLEPGNALNARMLRWAVLHRRASAGEAAATALLASELLAAKPRPASLLGPVCARPRADPALREDCLAHHLSRAEDAGAARAQVMSALAAAERLGPGPADRARMLRLHRSKKEYVPAPPPAPVPPKRDPAAALIERAAFAAATDRAAARSALAEARALDPAPAHARRMAGLYRHLGDHAAAQELLTGLLALPDAELPAPRAALAAEAVDLRLERASAALRTGDRAAALEALAAASALSPGAPARRRLAELYTELEERAPARALLDALIRAAPAEAGLRVARAAVADDRERALADLKEAAALRPSLEERRRMAYLRQDLKDHAGALALLDGLVKERPKDASLRADRGLSLYLNGREADALAELEAALKLDPGLEAASATRAAIRAAR